MERFCLALVAITLAACQIEDVDYYGGTGESTATAGSSGSDARCDGLACDIPDVDIDADVGPELAGAYCPDLQDGKGYCLTAGDIPSACTCEDPDNDGCRGETLFCIGPDYPDDEAIFAPCPANAPNGTIKCSGCRNNIGHGSPVGWWWDKDGDCSGERSCGDGDHGAAGNCDVKGPGGWTPIVVCADTCGT